MAKRTAPKTVPVPWESIEQAMAKTVAEGDFVNFRFLFFPSSPLRNESPEDIMTPKYAYLRPTETEMADPLYPPALARVRDVFVKEHIQKQLEKKGPPQLPYQLVLMLADNAMKLSKHSNAAQAYELLRIRRRMRDLFLEQGDAALDAGDIPRAARAYMSGCGLNYDYSAFPEPLPSAPDYQQQALLLHAEYPQRIEMSVALQPPEIHSNTALAFLLQDNEAAQRLEKRPQEQRLDLIAELVARLDPEWPAFVERYLGACDLVRRFGQRLERERGEELKEDAALADEAAGVSEETTPQDIPARLLGRSLDPGEWWQYMKELAFTHPAAPLFLTRQIVSRDSEIIMPRYRTESPLVARLGLAVQDDAA